MENSQTDAAIRVPSARRAGCAFTNSYCTYRQAFLETESLDSEGPLITLEVSPEGLNESSLELFLFTHSMWSLDEELR